ncbi:MAG: hypothetical protein HKM95_05965 [Inquilinus sp.]|nr:hypothetical protein [Inquilinus sp.]
MDTGTAFKLVYGIGFAVAILLNLYNWYILATRESSRRRAPGDRPDRLDGPAGPGLTARPLQARKNDRISGG